MPTTRDDHDDAARWAALVEVRQDAHGAFDEGHRDILEDLFAGPDVHLFDLACDIQLAPGLTLLAAVCAVHPYLSWDPRPVVPSYRRWLAAPSRWLLLRALRYALDPPVVERVRADELCHDDILVIGAGPHVVRRRVTGPYTSNNSTSYSLAPLDDPRNSAYREGGTAAEVTREVRGALAPRDGTNWALEEIQPYRWRDQGDAVVLVEVHGFHLGARTAEVERFVASRMPDVRVLRIGDAVAVPRRLCRHGDPLVPVAYRPTKPLSFPRTPGRSCEEFARRGTGEGTCGGPLDDDGRCTAPDRHAAFVPGQAR